VRVAAAEINGVFAVVFCVLASRLLLSRPVAFFVVFVRQVGLFLVVTRRTGVQFGVIIEHRDLIGPATVNFTVFIHRTHRRNDTLIILVSGRKKRVRDN
jgi:hypothetical protein